MDFAWPREIEARIEAARHFAEERLAPRGRAAAFDRDAWALLGDFDLFGTSLPPAWGGRALGALGAWGVFEALGRGGADRGLLFAAGAHLFGCAIPIAAYANETQVARLGTALRTGAMIGALAVTEPAGGSSLEAMATRAETAPGGYRLTGAKTLITNAPFANVVIVLARQFPDRGALGLTAFLVPRASVGLTIAAIGPTAGLKGAGMGTIRLEDCFVAEDDVLGRPGAGLRIFSKAMVWERTGLLAGFAGAAARDLVMIVDALGRRQDGGGSLLRHQAIAHRLARMRVRLDGARLLALRAAAEIDRGVEDLVQAATAKFALGEALVENAEDAARLLAGAGWRGEPFDAAQALSDVLGGLFASGTPEIQLDIIARATHAGHSRER